MHSNRQIFCQDWFICWYYSKSTVSIFGSLEEESEDLTTGVLLLGLLVVHDTVRSGQNNETELTGWEKVGGPFINLEWDIYTRGVWRHGANIRTFHPLVGVQSICSPLVEPIPRLLTIQACSRTWNRNQGSRNSETGYVRILSLWTFRIMRISRDIQRSENITWLMPTSNLGEMTPHLFKRPFNSTTILPALWSSMISNSPMYPCFIITWRNLMMT